MHIRFMLQQWLTNYIPQYCLLCRQANYSALCETCQTSIECFEHHAFGFDLMRWPKVIEAMRPNSLTTLHAVGDYQYPLSHWLKQLKFERNLLYAEILAELFTISVIKRKAALPDALIPAPLHTSRYLTRQFNQARVLAQSIGYRLKLPTIDQSLFRTEKTEPQTQLGRKQRLRNVENAFHANSLSSFKHVAIVDDVITTGATMQAMLDAVRKSNPNLKIEVWSIALALSSLDQVS